ncbi:nitroreductase family protein [Fulvimarina endophytica]|uniref:nitroreductase family protein n=1 Tax=Fulvimarina endophytica TaxID=2293836 RepID=UPI0013141384|nr:nitroreductase family protein [Fulvimarina endophytica]
MNSDISVPAGSAGPADPSDGRGMAARGLLRSRLSCQAFDPRATLSRAAIEGLIGAAVQAPSAFNLQNWRFVVAHSPNSRSRLKPAAYGQEKITDAAAVVIVVGIEPVSDAFSALMNRDEEDGRLPASERERLDRQIGRSYSDPCAGKAEAIRSASLAAMTLLLAAEADGIAACPMSGFDPAEVARAFALAAGETPVLLVALGRNADPAQVQKQRRPVSAVSSFA